MSNKKFNPYFQFDLEFDLQFAINDHANKSSSKRTAEIIASKRVLSSEYGFFTKNTFKVAPTNVSMKGFFTSLTSKGLKDTIDSREDKNALKKTNKLSKLLSKNVLIDKQKQHKKLMWVDQPKRQS